VLLFVEMLLGAGTWRPSAGFPIEIAEYASTTGFELFKTVKINITVI
jgi:hypothetical protein